MELLSPHQSSQYRLRRSHDGRPAILVRHRTGRQFARGCTTGLLLLLLAAGCGIRQTRLNPGPLAPGDWQIIGGGTANHGAANDQRVFTQADTLLWRHKVGAMASAEPMVRGGLLYYPGADGHLEVYDTRTGARLANASFKGPVTGVILGDSGFIVSTDQNEHRLVFMGYNPFEKRRAITIPASGAAPCRLDDGTLVVAAINGVVSRYDTLGNKLWTVDTEAPITAPPVLADSLLLIASGRAMSARRIHDGGEVWSHHASGAILSAAAIADRAYFGSTDSLLYAVNLATGAMSWFFASRGQIVVSPVIGPTRLYVGSNDYRVYALEMATGDTIWSYDTGGPVTTRPTLAGDILYVSTQRGELLVLNSSTGALVRSFTLEGPAATSPIVADGRVFIADNRRRLYCFGPTSAKTEPSTSTK